MRSTVLLFGLLSLINVTALVCETAKPCTKEEAIRAETEASSLANWADVHGSFKRFAQCDDGAIGEGYSSAVARLLSDNWNSVDQLNHLVLNDKAFEKFILHHVDELMSPAQAQKIVDNAYTHCPIHASRLCKALITRIKQIPADPSGTKGGGAY